MLLGYRTWSGWPPVAEGRRHVLFKTCVVGLLWRISHQDLRCQGALALHCVISKIYCSTGTRCRGIICTADFRGRASAGELASPRSKAALDELAEAAGP